MSYSYVNPYSGDEEETCSVSFAAQHKMAGSTGSAQTEAEYNKSKMLGEWGVIMAKLAKGEIPEGTKVLTLLNLKTKARGYLFVKDGKLYNRSYTDKGIKTEFAVDVDYGQSYIKSKYYETSIPQAVNKPKASAPTKAAPATVAAPTPATAVDPGSTSVGSMSHEDVSAMFVKVKDDLAKEQGLNIKGANPQLDKLVYAKIGEATGYTDEEVKGKIEAYKAAGNKLSALKKKVLAGTYKVPVMKVSDWNAAPGLAKIEGYKDGDQLPASIVGIKDLFDNVSGSDKVSPSQMSKTGPEEVIDLAGKVLLSHQEFASVSVVRKYLKNGLTGQQLPSFTVLPSGAVVIKDGNHKTIASLLAGQTKIKAHVNHLDSKEGKLPDPKPNGVPTTATPKLANEIKVEVKKEVASDPSKHYSDEDVAAAYIIAKDKVVAASNGKWTLYTKDAELDLQIAVEVGLKTGGLTPAQQKVAIANYLASGKKLSVLKKQLAKQGAFTPQADTLKKSGAAKSAADKAKDVDAKADAGYTPTPTPSAGTPKKDTGKPAPKRVERESAGAGDISGISDAEQLKLFQAFKAHGYATYLSSSNGENYEAFAKVKAAQEAAGNTYTLLQLIRVVDAQGAKKAGVDNGKLFEKKVATWLTSPEGTAHIKANEAKLAKIAEQAKAKAEAEKLAKELEKNQPPLPADSALFQEMTPSKALEFQRQQLAAKPFGPGEKEGLRHYTGSAYTEMNGYLRGLRSSISDTSKRHIEKAKKGFRPAPEHMLLRRGTGANQFLSLGVNRGDTSLLWGLTGKTFKDEGFLSTSAAGRAAFGGEVALEIETPPGAPCMWVDNFSQHPGENEMLLQAGCEFKILNVRKEGSTFVMRVRVVNWPGKDD